MTAARIARRLVRKIAKPLALWLADRKIRHAHARLRYFQRLMGGLVPHDQVRRVAQLTMRRNRIAEW